jgi:hypothetical protein
MLRFLINGQQFKQIRFYGSDAVNKQFPSSLRTQQLKQLYSYIVGMGC